VTLQEILKKKSKTEIKKTQKQEATVYATLEEVNSIEFHDPNKLNIQKSRRLKLKEKKTEFIKRVTRR